METATPAPAPRGRKKNKQLPAARRRYYVGDPVIVLSLADFERLTDHLTDMSLFKNKTINQQAAILQRHSLLLKTCRSDIKAAKQHYHITSTQAPDEC